MTDDRQRYQLGAEQLIGETPGSGDDDDTGPGIEQVNARLRHLADGIQRTDRDTGTVAAELRSLADGYRENPGAAVLAADNETLAGEIAACYQHVEVSRGRFARRLEQIADRLVPSGADEQGGVADESPGEMDDESTDGEGSSAKGQP